MNMNMNKKKRKIKWPVVPLCKKQLRDIRPEHVIFEGLYRICDVYKGGGGYDQFNTIFERRFGWRPNPNQFVIQLQGCPLQCPYCYVTQEGITGNPHLLSTDKILLDYESTGLEVFHLMGGAPALYLSNWKSLVKENSPIRIFHSDFLLVESRYKAKWLVDLPGLHAVSFKEKYLYTPGQLSIMMSNLETIIDCGVNFYITFTGRDEFSGAIKKRFGTKILEDSFLIPIKSDYKALL